jgi:aminoglycoside phosphotransferase (APT) family kinase protein
MAVLRLNTGSQMNLPNQIRYEFQTLQLLQNSGVTPKPVYCDDTRTFSPYGMLIMEYVPGNWLNYETGFRQAATVLAGIHKIKFDEKSPVIATPDPARAILNECYSMSDVYLNSNRADSKAAHLIGRIRDEIKQRVENLAPPDPDRLVLNNTEVNSSNFLYDDVSRHLSLVDWEKAVYSIPAQDISHFLVPTTTLWKTDYRFSEAEVDEFIRIYSELSDTSSGLLRDQLYVFWPLTCLRGISWCAMAYTEYMDPDRPLKSDFTFKKIQMYTDPDFIDTVFADALSR